jgi:uncharacterized protein (TIGR02099 family)
MERRPRRVFTWLITAGAVLVIMAAAASGLFQLAVQAVPGYREKVERDVRELTGRPVRIGQLGLTWRYYYPSLELIGVALLADDERSVLLQAERLRLGFGLTRLIRGDYLPNRLELHGLALDVNIDLDGQVKVRGIETEDTQGEPLEALRPLTRFAALRLVRCRVNLRDERRRGEVWSFGIAHAELDRGLLGDEISAELALPASIGDSARFEGLFTGELLEPSTWSGNGTVKLSGLTAGSWLAPFLERGTEVRTDGVEAHARGRIEAGRLAAAEVRLVAGPTRVQRARREVGFESLEARVGIEWLADGWKAQLRQFTLETAGGHWPETQGELRKTMVADAPPVYEGQVSYLRLADVLPWLRLMPVPAAVATLDQGTGHVRDAQFRFQGTDDPRYHFRARFDDLALPAGERSAGFAGLRGELAGDDRGGRAVLQETALQVDLPGVLVNPKVGFEAFEAELEWSRRESGWRIGMPQFRWELLGTRGRGRFDLLLPADSGRSPEIDLAAQFLSEDVTRAKTLMPSDWSSGLRTWLDRSIVRGRAPKAELTIKGPLADFPFVERDTGAWRLDIDAQDVELAYHPDWPAVENLAAALVFRGTSLGIESTQGTVSGNAIRSVAARFPDFRTGQLLIDGTVTGETAKYYEFLARSPLRDTFKTLLAQTTAVGPARVEIHLDIPVNEPMKTRTRGRVALDGVELRHGGLPQPIRDIHGTIDFDDNEGVSADKLTAKLYDIGLEAKLVPQSAKVTQLTAGFRFGPDPLGKGASELVPAFILRKIRGASDWRAELTIGGPGETPVRLSTDLAGVDVQLPPPLGKTAEQSVPLSVTIGSKPGAPLHIGLEYHERFGADLRFARARGGMALQRGALRAGAGPAPAATEPGLVLGGTLADFDARAWSQALQGAGLERQAETIRRADVQVARAVWDRFVVRDARYQWTSQPGGWSLKASGGGAAGELSWKSADRGQLSARLTQLALEYLPPVETTDAEEITDPAQLPLLDVDVQQLAINQVNIGHLALATARTDAGQKLRTLRIDGGPTTFTGEGEWRRRAGQSSAMLNADLATADITGLLRAFQYTPNLDAKSARFQGALTWAPSERGVEWHQAQGTVHLEFDNGQLRAVEPGAGRVLGLVNFYALPRRLTLNFRDVLGSGLGFDKVNGDFELRDGSARTQNLSIAGPSLRMDVKGRIGLAARDYDQQVTVYPDVSAGVTLGAVLLGGPVAGALALIAQEVLNKPLNQVTQLTYRVTGTWDNPQVERGAAQEPEPRARRSGSPSQKP